MILLTTPFNPGDVEPGASYTHARVAYVELDARNMRIKLSVDYMYQDAGLAWHVGNAGRFFLAVEEDAFHNLKKIKPKKSDGDIVREWSKACEQYLVDEALVDGTIIEDPLLDDPPPPA